MGKNIEIFSSFDAELKRISSRKCIILASQAGDKGILYQTVDRLDFIEIGILTYRVVIPLSL
jgi:hypothetical protein